MVGGSHDYQDDESYTYDDNGNRTDDGYVTGENNQLESDGTYNYEYDAEGNRVKRTEIATGEVTEYEWDHRNRLVAVETVDESGNVTSNSDYTYDVFNRRIAKSVDADGDGAGSAVVERYVHDGDHIALTFDGEGNQTERFLHGLGIDEVLAQENAGGEVLWALADNQGSVRMVLDNEGNVVNEITYDAFGNITVESNPDVNFRFSYTGREFDEETGLYNYRSRYYDPAVGQFISQDTIGFAGGDSNLYRYVANNSVNYVDPFGFRGGAARPVRRGGVNNNFNRNINNRTQPKPSTGSRGTGSLGSPGYNNPNPPNNAPVTGHPHLPSSYEEVLWDALSPLRDLADKFWGHEFWDSELPWQNTEESPDENEEFADKVRKGIEEINEDNARRQEENNGQGASCPNPNYVPPEASGENPSPEANADNSDNGGDGQPEGDGDGQPQGIDGQNGDLSNDIDPDIRSDEEVLPVDDIVNNPLSIAGRSAEDIARQFNDAGYEALIEQSTKKGTSGKAIQVRIKHPEISNIQVHPGGGRHTPEGVPYWKVSTSTQGKIWVIPRSFRGADTLGGKAVYYE